MWGRYDLTRILSVAHQAQDIVWVDFLFFLWPGTSMMTVKYSKSGFSRYHDITITHFGHLFSIYHHFGNLYSRWYDILYISSDFIQWIAQSRKPSPSTWNAVVLGNRSSPKGTQTMDRSETIPTHCSQTDFWAPSYHTGLQKVQNQTQHMVVLYPFLYPAFKPFSRVVQDWNTIATVAPQRSKIKPAKVKGPL